MIYSLFQQYTFLFTFFTVFFSFLKRERERFPLFVPKSYCVTTRTFLSVHGRSTSLTVHRSWSLPWPFLSVPERSANGQERSGTVMVTVNGQGRWTVCNDHTLQGKRSETFAKSRSRSRFKNERNTVFIIHKLHTNQIRKIFQHNILDRKY